MQALRAPIFAVIALSSDAHNELALLLGEVIVLGELNELPWWQC